jgi:hypothetical protein
VTVDELSGGDLDVDVLVIPGIFESVQLARCVAARLREDAEHDATSRSLLERARFTFRAVVPPGYEAHAIVQDRLPHGPKLEPSPPDNDEYRRRILAAIDARPENAVSIHFHHSWGGSVCAPLWETGEWKAPDIAILSAPAWSDCVTLGATVGGRLLAVPLLRALSTYSVPPTLRCLFHTGIDEIRELSRRLPAGYSSHAVARQSYVEVTKGRELCVDGSLPAIPRAGKKVVIAQGTADKAVRGKKTITRYETLIAERDDWKEVMFVAEPDGTRPYGHWPFLEKPALLGETLAKLI